MSTDRSNPAATPPVVEREVFEQRLAAQVVREKALTRLADTVSAARRRLPMVELDDYRFTGSQGPVALTELFGEHRLLLLQHFMFAPDWETGCPSCTFAVDNLPADMSRLDEAGIAFALVSQAPVARVDAWRDERGWSHTWVSSGGTTFHDDWDWVVAGDDGPMPQPGYMYLLLHDQKPYLTYLTRRRGTEAILPLPQIMDRTCYGRQQDWEDSPEGWPQRPTYG